MTTKDKALKLALDALEDPLAPTKRMKAITAIREALAEQPAQQQPAAMAVQQAVVMLKTGSPEYDFRDVLDVLESSLAAQPAKQTPVAWVHLESWMTGKYWPDDCFSALPVDGWHSLYTAPANKPFVGLTDEEIQPLLSQNRFAVFALARAIEAKLKEKNT